MLPSPGLPHFVSDPARRPFSGASHQHSCLHATQHWCCIAGPWSLAAAWLPDERAWAVHPLPVRLDSVRGACKRFTVIRPPALQL